MKNNVAPLQAAQAALIAKRVALINLRLTMYREQFKLKEVNSISKIKAIIYIIFYNIINFVYLNLHVYIHHHIHDMFYVISFA